MVSFLFWNLNNRNIYDIVAKIALRNDIDIIMLVETSFMPAALLEKLNEGNVAKLLAAFFKCLGGSHTPCSPGTCA